MKPIDYLYFNIYNHFYQRSFSTRNFVVRIQAMYLFSLSAGGWILFLEAAYLRTVRHSSASTTGTFVFVQMVGALIGFLLGAYLSDIIGRKLTFFISAASTAVMVLIFMFVRGAPSVAARLSALVIVQRSLQRRNAFWRDASQTLLIAANRRHLRDHAGYSAIGGPKNQRMTFIRSRDNTPRTS